MSGGAFDYQQFRILDMAKDLKDLMDYRRVEGMCLDMKEPPEFDKLCKEAYDALRLGATIMHRIDWYVSGDDGLETMFSRLKDDLIALGEEEPWD